VNKKQLRYYYWLVLEFSRKHSKMIVLSFLVSFFVILSITSFSSYFDELFFPHRDINGVVGQFDLTSIPESITSKLSYGLVYLDEKGNARPAIATSWEMKDAGKQFIFHIKDGLTWDDGRPFSARELRYSFKDVTSRALDDRTIVFTLKKPLAIFPTYLARPIIRYPLKGVIGQYKVDQIKFALGYISEITLTPNKHELIPITYKFYANENALVNAYKSGEIRQMVLTKKPLADQFLTWKNSTVTKDADYSTAMALFFNLNKQELQDKDVRHAISESIKRDVLAEQGVLSDSPIPPTSWAYNPDLKQALYAPTDARKILKKDLESSSSAALRLVTYYDYLPVANEIQSKLVAAGAKTDVILNNSPEPGDFDMLLVYWHILPDPDQYFFWHSTQIHAANITNYNSVKVDKILEDARSTLVVGKRKEFYLQFQKVFADDLPALFLYYPYQYTVKRK
jgi:peptide/nickel transport system substrate-binding protein